MCECCCNALGSCFTCVYDITRSVPVWSTLAFVLFLVGHGLAINGRQATSREMNAMGLQGLTGWLDDLELALLFSLALQLKRKWMPSFVPFRLSAGFLFPHRAWSENRVVLSYPGFQWPESAGGVFGIWEDAGSAIQQGRLLLYIMPAVHHRALYLGPGYGWMPGHLAG